MSFTDSLRGYSFRTHRRDRFRCLHCELDGSTWPYWLLLSRDHLLPSGHPDRDKSEFIVTACRFCNEAENRLFEKVKALGLRFDNMTLEELVEQRRRHVEKVRRDYRNFWEANVRGTARAAPRS